MPSTLTVVSATVLTGVGTDQIHLVLDHPTTFPDVLARGESDYGCHANIEAQAGTGVEWVRTVLGIEPKLIDRG
jgi:hypothetical protein